MRRVVAGDHRPGRALRPRHGGSTPMTDPLPTGSQDRMNSADPTTKGHADAVQDGRTTRNPRAKVPSDLYPDPPGITDTTPGGKDD